MKNRAKKFKILILMIGVFLFCMIGAKALEIEGKVEIEFPIINYKYKDLMYIQGYALATDKTAKLEVELNGNKIEGIERYERKDLGKLIQNYGGKENNEKAGYYKTIDISNLKDGEYELNVILKKETGEVITQKKSKFIVKKYEGEVEIEYPIKNYKYSTVMYIQGYSLSNCSKVKRKITIDGKDINEVDKNITIQGYKRNDLNSKLKKYGENNNKEIGYSSTINLSNLEDNMEHEINVQIISEDTNEVIAEKSKKFYISKYSGEIKIEYPINNYEYKTQMYIQGYAISDCNNIELEINIDGTKQIKYQEYNRDDIKTSKTKKAYYTTVDLSEIEDGIHTVNVIIKNGATKKEIKRESKKIKVHKYQAKSKIENPITSYKYKDIMYIQGWAVSTDKNAKVEIKIDNKLIAEADRYKREDIKKEIENYGGKESNEAAGYFKTIDLTDIPDGSHILSIEVRSEKTGEVISTSKREFNMKKYDGIIKTEYPIKDYKYKTNMYIQGYALDTSKDSYVALEIDGKDLGNIERYVRTDIEKEAEKYNKKEKAGFFKTIDFINYYGSNQPIKDGEHTLTIKVMSSKIKGEVITSKSEKFIVKKYDGIVNFDMERSMFSINSSIEFSGYEKSELDNSTVKIFIDNKELTGVSRFSNSEVLDRINKINGYGNASMNATPGFSVNIDFSKFSTGSHNLKVELWTKLGEKIDTKNKKIFIYKNVRFGVDVSKYQGNINWKKVRNDGITFAMIRLGNRGWGTGKIELDPYFVNNMKNAKAAGIKVGVYFYSQAINEAEAEEEANFVINNLALVPEVKVDYPVAFDTEFTTPARDGRADGLSKSRRTAIAKKFLEKIKKKYKPAVYASKSFLNNNLDMNQLQSYDVWLAHYTGTNDPVNNPSNYKGVYQIWQYTSSGRVNGINGNVDIDLGYKEY